MEGFDVNIILEIINEIIALIKRIIGLIPNNNVGEETTEATEEQSEV